MELELPGVQVPEGPWLLCLCSIILSTAQFLSAALHKNFTDADFDFKVGAGRVPTPPPGCSAGPAPDLG